MKRKSPAPRKGRPRAFDADQALERALMVFWKKGFDGASLPDLTKAMRINRPSLYATFGNKEALFRKALDRYVTGPASFVREALDLPTARAVAQNVLRGTLLLLTDPDHPRGCLIVQAALACGDTSRCIQKELVAKREAGVIALRKRFERAIKERDLPASADPADLARYLATIIHGMSVEAASGAGRAQLQRVVDLAMRAWPN